MNALLLTIPECAQELRCHVSTIRRWIASGRLAHVKLGGKHGKILIRRVDLNDAVLRARVVAVGESAMTASNPVNSYGYKTSLTRPQ